jgi:hypothetical protein
MLLCVVVDYLLISLYTNYDSCLHVPAVIVFNITPYRVHEVY